MNAAQQKFSQGSDSAAGRDITDHLMGTSKETHFTSKLEPLLLARNMDYVHAGRLDKRLSSKSMNILWISGQVSIQQLYCI